MSAFAWHGLVQPIALQMPATVLLLLRAMGQSQDLPTLAYRGRSQASQDPRPARSVPSPLCPGGPVRVFGAGVAQAATAPGDPGSGRAAWLSGPARPR